MIGDGSVGCQDSIASSVGADHDSDEDRISPGFDTEDKTSNAARITFICWDVL
jgi:hypothetical protein